MWTEIYFDTVHDLNDERQMISRAVFRIRPTVYDEAFLRGEKTISFCMIGKNLVLLRFRSPFFIDDSDTDFHAD